MISFYSLLTSSFGAQRSQTRRFLLWSLMKKTLTQSSNIALVDCQVIITAHIRQRMKAMSDEPMIPDIQIPKYIGISVW